MARLSIALPVYNGERYLAEALESLRAQTFEDWEALICDNASTDGTAAIAREIAQRDPRFNYHRNEANIGAAPNFNRAFELAPRAPYFKWAAVDDLLDPSYFERAIAILDADPGAVLAYSKTRFIDATGAPGEIYGRRPATDHASVSMRYRSLLMGHGCYEVFGIIRRDVLERTPLIGCYSHGDGVLLARLAMHGRFEEIPEPLFFSRKHDEQSMTMVGNYHDYAVWFDPRLAGKRVFPRWRWSYEFLKCIPAGHASAIDRLKCLRSWMRYAWRVRHHLAAELRVSYDRA